MAFYFKRLFLVFLFPTFFTFPLLHFEGKENAGESSSFPAFNRLCVAVFSVDTLSPENMFLHRETADLLESLFQNEVEGSLGKRIVAKGGYWRIIETMSMVQVGMFLPVSSEEGESLVREFISGLRNALPELAKVGHEATLPDLLVGQMLSRGMFTGKSTGPKVSLWTTGILKSAETRLSVELQCVNSAPSPIAPESASLTMAKFPPYYARIGIWQNFSLPALINAQFLAEEHVNQGINGKWKSDIWLLPGHVVLAFVASAPVSNLFQLKKEARNFFSPADLESSKVRQSQFVRTWLEILRSEKRFLEKGAFLQALQAHGDLDFSGVGFDASSPDNPETHAPSMAFSGYTPHPGDNPETHAPSMAFSGYTPHPGDKAGTEKRADRRRRDASHRGNRQDGASFSQFLKGVLPPPDQIQEFVCLPEQNLHEFILENSGNPVFSVAQFSGGNRIDFCLGIRGAPKVIEDLGERLDKSGVFSIGEREMRIASLSTLLYRFDLAPEQVSSTLSSIRSVIYSGFVHPEALQPSDPPSDALGNKPRLVLSAVGPIPPFEILGEMKEAWPIESDSASFSTTLSLSALSKALETDNLRSFPLSQSLIKGRWITQTSTPGGIACVLTHFALDCLRLKDLQEVQNLLDAP